MIYVSKKTDHDSAMKLIYEGDLSFDRRLTKIADSVLAGSADGRQIKFITLSGPSCSGKTTASSKLAAEIEKSGRRIHSISIDDYYFDREVLLKKTAGKDIDLDSPSTINTADISKTIKDILSGKPVIEVPVFDFVSGTRSGSRNIEVNEDDVFIFEGIQAMYENVAVLFEGSPTASVFINVMQGINADGVIFTPNMIRLMRRLVRDADKRGADAKLTLELWKNVRKNEDLNIFPLASNVDYIIDSVMPYELGILKNFIDKVLECDGLDDEFSEIVREISDNMDGIYPISVNLLGKDSLYNEFVRVRKE